MMIMIKPKIIKSELLSHLIKKIKVQDNDNP